MARSFTSFGVYFLSPCQKFIFGQISQSYLEISLVQFFDTVQFLFLCHLQRTSALDKNIVSEFVYLLFLSHACFQLCFKVIFQHIQSHLLQFCDCQFSFKLQTTKCAADLFVYWQVCTTKICALLVHQGNLLSILIFYYTCI